MSNTLNDADRLQNIIDGLEVLILQSQGELDNSSQAERQRLEQSTQRIFAASVGRAKIEVKSGAAVLSLRESKAKQSVPFVDRIRELAFLLKGRSDIEPRLQAVFDSPEELGDVELDKIIQDASKLGQSQEKSKKTTRRK